MALAQRNIKLAPTKKPRQARSAQFWVEGPKETGPINPETHPRHPFLDNLPSIAIML